MITLGIYSIPDPNDKAPCNTHDHGLALMENGKVLAMAELERLTRQKHDNKLYLHLDKYVTNGYFPLPDSLQAVFVDSYFGRRFSTPTGLILMEAEENKTLYETIQPASGKFSGKKARIWLCPHELAHVGSCLPFTGGFEENSLLIHIDGGASQSNCSAWHYRNGQIRHLHHSWQFKTHNINYEDSPLTCAILGIHCDESVLLSVAGKLMGYTSFGTAHPELKDWLAVNNWFQDRKDGLKKFQEYAARDHGWSANSFDIRDRFLMDVAACMQAALHEDVEKYIFSFQNQTGAKHLYYSGGVALNIHINSSIEKSGRFDSIHIPPCCNDSGLALGAAALMEFLEHGRVEQHSPFLNSMGLDSYTYQPEFDVHEVAKKIAHGEIIGVCTGSAETGPRALGRRSLLAHPGDVRLRDRLSIDMKKREWYRPVAPLVLRSEAEKLFSGSSTSSLSRFMLGSYNVRPEARNLIEGVVHADGSSRAQLIDDDDPDLRLITEILKALRDIHGIPCLINTSFNTRGEPIVHTHNDALLSARKLGLDALILDNQLLELKLCNCYNPIAGKHI